MELRGVVEVEGVGLLHAVLLAQHSDVLTFSLDGEVAGKAEGIEDGETVLVDVVFTGSADFADDRYLLVVETDDDNGVENELLFEDDVLDVFCDLVTGLALDIDFAQGGEVDISALVNGIGKAGVVAVGVVG